VVGCALIYVGAFKRGCGVFPRNAVRGTNGAAVSMEMSSVRLEASPPVPGEDAGDGNRLLVFCGS